MFKSLIFVFQICILDNSSPLGFYCLHLLENPLTIYDTYKDCDISATKKVNEINDMLKKDGKQAIHLSYICLDIKKYKNS